MRNRTPIIWIGLVIALVGLFLSGCKKAKMEAGEVLQEKAALMSVQGRGAFDQDFSFGPYRATEIHRGWTRREAWNIFGYRDVQARQRFEFRLSGNSEWVCNCATGLDEQTLKTLAGESSTVTFQLSTDIAFVATFMTPESRPWKMVLTRATEDPAMKGFLSDKQTTLRVEGTNKLADTDIPLTQASGYFFRQGENLLGAVDVLNDGQVFLMPSESAETREILACAASALLLFQDLSEFK